MLAVQMAEKKTKRAHKTLSIAEEVEILDQIPNKSYKVLSEKYGVGTSTISDKKKQGPELRDYKRKMTEMGCMLPSKTMKMGKDQKLEEAVFLWFRQKREQGIPVSGKVIKSHEM